MVLVVAGWGCTAPTALEPAELVIDASQYGAAFDAAREVLSDARFELDRVDARAGVITTYAKSTAGLATPWDTEQSSLLQELEDLVHLQVRRVRVTFEPVEESEAGADADRRALTGRLLVTVRVVVDRVQRPGTRLAPAAIGRSSTATDPALSGRGMMPAHAVPMTEDRQLAHRLARAMERQVARAGR